MASDRQFTNPDYGKQARVEQQGCEVALVFVASSEAKATALAENIVNQMRNGALNITLMGTPTSVTED